MNKNIEICLGIDFGTTNSCLSIWYDNKSIIITDCDGSDTIPTVIEISNDNKIIGREAYFRKDIFNLTNTDKNNKSLFLVYEIKKLLGKKYSELNEHLINLLGFKIKSDDDDNIIIYDDKTLKSYYTEEIATHLFMSFKTKAEIFLTNKFNSNIIINKAVISVPAFFNKNQREVIKKSAEYAGFEVLRLINEPTAAALSYGLGKNITSVNGLNLVVFDFGGGTLDTSILNINDGVYEVLGSCGNNNLGGSDFDGRIMEYCIKTFITENNISYEEFIISVDNNILQKLKYLSEQTKIILSNSIHTKIKIDNFYNNLNLNVNINREIFNQITHYSCCFCC